MTKSIIAFLLFLVGTNSIISQNQKIYISRVKNADNSVDFNYIKSVSGNYFIEFELESATNVQDLSDFKKSYNLNLSADSGTLFKLSPIDKEKPIYCAYTYSYKRGLVKPEIDNATVYLLPFKENKNVTIYQSTRYNVSPDTWKLYSVYSATKDTIYAMRKGVVTEIKKFTADYNGKTIFRTEIIVDHADGTNASYIGVDEKTLAVNVNDQIFPGSRLATMDDVLDSEKKRNFKFNVYYFSNEEIQGLDGKNVKIIERSVMPAFYTSEGYQNLESDKNYTVKYNDEILVKEMTPQEREVYKIQSKV